MSLDVGIWECMELPVDTKDVCGQGFSVGVICLLGGGGCEGG